MDHHNLAMIRGDRKNPALGSPSSKEYQELYEYVRRLWASREKQRYGSIVEPMLQWAKVRTAARGHAGCPLPGRRPERGRLFQRRCQLLRKPRAGRQSSHSSLPGDLALGAGHALRQSIRAKECTCTNEVFLWPSIVYQPLHLIRALVGAKPWRAAQRSNPLSRFSSPSIPCFEQTEARNRIRVGT